MSILDKFGLDRKTLFVTGGSRGLGREMALAEPKRLIEQATAEVLAARLG